MFNLSIYLEKFKDLKNPNDLIFSIKKIVSEELGFPLSEENVTFSKGRIIFSVSSIIKNSIYMKKEIIIQRIQKELPESRVIDIS